jgi:hypothetical protein
MIDLHTHSNASDGILTPSELVELAARIELRALALTDHDTMAGVREARIAAAACGLTFIPGIEISSQFERGALHIVGLYLDPENVTLSENLARLVELRDERNALIADKLCEIGMPIRMQEVETLAGGGVIGRPHFAELMVRKGYVKRFKNAFKKYLERGRPAYTPRQKLSPERTIEVILEAGGVPILAHPDQTRRKGDALEQLIGDLTDMGLKGLEAYCSNYSIGHIHRYIRLAKKYGLLVSGGSDFHGAIKSGILLGKGSGSLRVPDDLIGPIADQARKIQSSS